MKILLTAVNSKYIHSNLAVYSLKAYHDAHSDRKDTVELAEYTIPSVFHSDISPFNTRNCMAVTPFHNG